MIKNEESWRLEEAPRSFTQLLDQLEAGEDQAGDLDSGGLYAQRLYNSDSGFMQVHTGYFRPEWAEEYHLEETPFQEELFFSCEPTGTGSTEVYIRYTGDPLEIFEDSRSYSNKIVSITEDKLQEVVLDLKSEGFLDWQGSRNSSVAGSDAGLGL